MTEKMGGKSRMRVGVMGTLDILDALVAKESESAGSRLSAALRSRYDGRFDIDVEELPALGWTELSLSLASADSAKAPSPWEAAARGCDILVISVASGVNVDQDLAATAEIEQIVADVVGRLKDVGSAHIIAFNVSNLDPGDPTFNYFGTAQTPSERARRWNLALLRSSITQGISIIDVDRIVAETLAPSKVTGFLEYSEQVSDAILEEFLRVTADIGFYDDRPLLAQVGRQEVE